MLAHRLHALPYAATLGYLDGIDDDLLGKNLLAGSVSIDPRDPCLYMYMPSVSHQSIYLGSVLQKDGDIDEDVRHRISAGWLVEMASSFWRPM